MRYVKASDFLTASLRSLILSELRPGDRLPREEDLLENFGCSRSALREALRILEREGLIINRRGAHGGAFVAEPTTSHVRLHIAQLFTVQEVSLRDFIAFRRLIEPEIAALAAEVITEEQAEQLSTIVQFECGASSREDLKEAPAKFHAYLGECSGNKLYSLVLSLFYPLYEGHIRDDLAHSDVRNDSVNAHKYIAESVIAHDAVTARRRMARHLAAFQEFLEDAGVLDGPIVARERWADAANIWGQPTLMPPGYVP